MRVAVLLLLLLSTIASCSRQAPAAAKPAEVRIAAAASLKPVMVDLTTEFKKIAPKITLTITYGASGSLYSQIVNGGPFDMFLSADTSYPQKLVDAGLSSGQVIVYGSGRLCLWTSNTTGLDLAGGLDILKDERVKKIAIANAEHAPYGKAAAAALRTAGILDALGPKLVMGENIEQTATFARTGAAEVALVSKTQASTAPLKNEGRSYDIPEALYQPIQHGAAIIKSAQDPTAAQAFLNFLAGPSAQPVLSSRGLAAGR